MVAVNLPAGAFTGLQQSGGGGVSAHIRLVGLVGLVRRLASPLGRRGAFVSALLLLALSLGGLLTPREAAGGVVAAAGADPLRGVRTLRRLELRVAGATVSAAPPAELQQSTNDCGPVVVERLLRLHGRTVPARSQLATLLNVGPRGATLEQIATGLRTLGWPATVRRTAAVRASGHAMPIALRVPAVALMRPGHFVLLTRQTPSLVEYFDPLVGQVRESPPHFVARWTGKGVQLSAGDN
ncbi:hypothetical protein MASR1M101_23980 [Gemmatimonas sp.]